MIDDKYTFLTVKNDEQLIFDYSHKLDLHKVDTFLGIFLLVLFHETTSEEGSFFVGLVQQEEKNDVLWTFDESYIIV